MEAHERLGITREEMAERNPATLRTIERLENDEWVICRMKDLKKGDRFRFLDDHIAEFVAEDDAYINDYYVWSINGNFINLKANLNEAK